MKKFIDEVVDANVNEPVQLEFLQELVEPEKKVPNANTNADTLQEIKNA